MSFSTLLIHKVNTYDIGFAGSDDYNNPSNKSNDDYYEEIDEVNEVLKKRFSSQSLEQLTIELKFTKSIMKLSNQDKSCKKCNKSNSRTCSNCKKVHYCSKECQASDWKIHKVHCKKYRKGKLII